MALIAIVALTALLALSLAVITLGGGAQLSGRREARNAAAQALADAGVEYAYWKWVYGSSLSLPYTTSRALGRGTISVTIQDNSAGIASSVKMTCTAAVGDATSTTTRVYPTTGRVVTVFDYALCANKNLNSNHGIVTGAAGADGDVMCNGNLTLNDPTSVVNGNASATGTINITSVTGTKTASSTAITFPPLDTSTTGVYARSANRSFSGNQTWSGFTFLTANEIVYVNGGVTLNAGTISGTGTLVVSGAVSIKGSLAYSSSSDRWALLGGGNITFTTACSAAGFFYAHNGGNSGKISLNQPVNITSGGLAADTFAINQDGNVVVHDAAMGSALGAQLHLPGYWP